MLAAVDGRLVRPALALCLSLLVLASCSRSYDGSWNPPLLYKLDIQQGNALEQHMLSMLKPGMTRDQVRFIMGSPVLVDPFRKDRWDYVYTFQEDGGLLSRRHVVLYFEGDSLVRVSGDVVGVAGLDAEQERERQVEEAAKAAAAEQAEGAEAAGAVEEEAATTVTAAAEAVEEKVAAEAAVAEEEAEAKAVATAAVEEAVEEEAVAEAEEEEEKEEEKAEAPASQNEPRINRARPFRSPLPFSR